GKVRFGDLLLQLRKLCAGRVEIPGVERALHALDRAEQPRRLAQSAAEVVLDVARRRAMHTGYANVAAERDCADAVLDPFPLHLDERGREADVEAPRAHADRARADEVARLVNEDEEREPEDRNEDVHATGTFA